MSGYVPPDEYETKRQHRQLNGMMLCSRCSDLSHGRMVNAVAGQGGAKLSAGLITPSELREQLTRIRDEKVLVVKVVDATDFHGSFLNRVRDVVGANPILLVLTKVDLLPRGTDLDALREWVANEVTVKRRLTLAGVVCVSSRQGVGMREGRVPPCGGDPALEVCRGSGGRQTPTLKRAKPVTCAPASSATLATVFLLSLANGWSSSTFSLK